MHPLWLSLPKGATGDFTLRPMKDSVFLRFVQNQMLNILNKCFLTSKYKAIMSALAEWLYEEFRKK